GQITGNTLTITGGVNADNPNTNTLVSAASGEVTLSNTTYTMASGTPPVAVAQVKIANIQVANLSATSINSSDFKGSVVSLTGAPVCQSDGPQNVNNGQVEARTPQGNPVSGEVLAIAVNPVNPKQVFIGTSNGGVWKTDDINATIQVSIAEYEDPLRDPAPDVKSAGTTIAD